jgi:hypothetical protein
VAKRKKTAKEKKKKKMIMIMMKRMMKGALGEEGEILFFLLKNPLWKKNS